MMSWLEEEVGTLPKTKVENRDERDQRREALETETRLYAERIEQLKIWACGASHQQLQFCPSLQRFDEVKLDAEQKNPAQTRTAPHEISLRSYLSLLYFSRAIEGIREREGREREHTTLSINSLKITRSKDITAKSIEHNQTNKYIVFSLFGCCNMLDCSILVTTFYVGLCVFVGLWKVCGNVWYVVTVWKKMICLLRLSVKSFITPHSADNSMDVIQTLHKILKLVPWGWALKRLIVSKDFHNTELVF